MNNQLLVDDECSAISGEKGTVEIQRLGCILFLGWFYTLTFPFILSYLSVRIVENGADLLLCLFF